MSIDIDGDLRFSIQWNADGKNNVDFDAHCVEPCGKEIAYYRKISPVSGGNLDVDIITPGIEVAVESITFPDRRKMQKGVYLFFVRNSSFGRTPAGFTAKIEFGGQIHTFSYDKTLRTDERVRVASVTLNEEGNFELESLLVSTKSLKQD